MFVSFLRNTQSLALPLNGLMFFRQETRSVELYVSRLSERVVGKTLLYKT